MCFGPSDNPFEVSWVNRGRRFPAFVLIDRRGSYEKTSQAARLVDSPLTVSPPQPRRATRQIRTTAPASGGGAVGRQRYRVVVARAIGEG